MRYYYLSRDIIIQMYNVNHFTFIFQKQIFFCKRFGVITVLMTFALDLDGFYFVFYFAKYIVLSIE